ncbi:MAG TPA: biotin/lipoyl-binding protein, partial [Caulobacteraceae bacterium]|nr:biotin/lipoyl-binding protein [Caulobacteraceae bacterium]
MPSLSKQRLVQILGGGALALAVIAGGAVWWANRQHYESTDNAFVQADTVLVSPQVSGYVAEVLVADNQRVIPGQVLVRLDPSTFEAKLAQAQANAASQLAAIRSVDDRAKLEEAMVAQKAAGVTSAQAQAAMTTSDMDRYRALAQAGWVSPQKIQSQKASADQSAAAVAQAQATLQAEQKSAQALGSARSQSVAQAAGAQA